MATEKKSPPGPEDNKVTFTFELTFKKIADVVLPGSNSLHELRAICFPRHHGLIALEAASICGDHNLTDETKDAIRKFYENRALLSVATAFVDAEFAAMLHGLMPPPPDFKPKRPKPKPRC